MKNKDRVRELEAKIERIEERLNWIQEAAAEVQKATDSVIFSEAGRNRVAEAHERITQETHRLNVLREGIASLSQQTNSDRETLNNLVGLMSQLERNAVAESQFTNLVMRVRDLECKFDNHLQWAAQHDHPDDLAERIRNLEGEHMSPDHSIFRCGHPVCRRDAAAASKGALSRLWDNSEPIQVEDFSPPIGGVVHDPEIETITGRMTPGFRRGYEQGLRDGQKRTFELVDQRAVTHMRGRISEFAIGSLVRALRGDEGQASDD